MAPERKKNPLLGAAVMRAMLERRGAEGETDALYQGVLRDLGLRDEQVQEYLREHRDEVEAAIRSHGRR